MVTHLAPTHLPYAHKSNDTINLYLRTALVVPPKIPSKPISLLWAAANNTLCSNFYLFNLISLLLSFSLLLLLLLPLAALVVQEPDTIKTYFTPSLNVQTFTF